MCGASVAAGRAILYQPLLRRRSCSCFCASGWSKRMPSGGGVAWHCSHVRFFSLAEFSKIAFATGAGFLIMGFIGFFVKLMYVKLSFFAATIRGKAHAVVRGGGVARACMRSCWNVCYPGRQIANRRECHTRAWRRSRQPCTRACSCPCVLRHTYARKATCICAVQMVPARNACWPREAERAYMTWHARCCLRSEVTEHVFESERASC